jgi:hypothetical protein
MTRIRWCEGDKYQERDKLRLEGMIAKLDMLWRLQTMQTNGKRMYRAPTRQSAVTPGRRGNRQFAMQGQVGEEKQPEQRGYQFNLNGFRPPNAVGICSTFFLYLPTSSPS